MMKAKKQRFVHAGVSLTLLGALAAGGGMAARAATDTKVVVASAGTDASSVEDAQTRADKAEIERDLAEQQRELDAIAADPEASADLVAAKEADLADYGREREERATAAKDGEDASVWPEGIFEDSEVPAPGAELLGSNRWVGTVDGAQVAVYAGQGGYDETLGRLLVMWRDDDARDSRPGGFVDLPGAGRLTVVSAQDGVVVVSDAGGAVHHYDVTSGSWRS